jgi:hypothetical protein
MKFQLKTGCNIDEAEEPAQQAMCYELDLDKHGGYTGLRAI